jgi:hypothetical protein
MILMGPFCPGQSIAPDKGLQNGYFFELDWFGFIE